MSVANKSMKKIIIGGIVVLVLVIGGWFLLSKNTQAPVTQNNQQTNQAPPENTGTLPTSISPTSTNPSTQNTADASIKVEVATSKTYDVTYKESGYSPSTLTIKAGDTVTFKNQGPGGMWTASGMHPSHTVYSGTTLQQHCPDSANNSFDECQSVGTGQSWSFTFTKTGTWGYHNHVNASQFGKIIVE